MHDGMGSEKARVTLMAGYEFQDRNEEMKLSLDPEGKMTYLNYDMPEASGSSMMGCSFQNSEGTLCSRNEIYLLESIIDV
jgi:hypothetical protein